MKCLLLFVLMCVSLFGTLDARGDLRAACNSGCLLLSDWLLVPWHTGLGQTDGHGEQFGCRRRLFLQQTQFISFANALRKVEQLGLRHLQVLSVVLGVTSAF